MKKNYLKPSTELLDLVVSNIMVDTSTIVGGGADPGEEAGVNRGRGEWGNVWAGGNN